MNILANSNTYSSKEFKCIAINLDTIKYKEQCEISRHYGRHSESHTNKSITLKTRYTRTKKSSQQ